MNNKGLTLVEILVAAGLALLIGLGLYLSLGNNAAEHESKIKGSIIIPDSGKNEEPNVVPEEKATAQIRSESDTHDNEISPTAPSPKAEEKTTIDGTFVEKEGKENTGVPADLFLPFRIEDIDEQNGEINPVGVVRFSADEPRVGHSGLDVPLYQGANILAAADGTIILIDSASDPWNGKKIYQLLRQTSSGQGWAYIYEHVEPVSSLRIGSDVSRGDVIATKSAPSGFTAHFQLSFLFNNFQYIKDVQCWPDLLDAESTTQLDTWWSSYRDSVHLRGSWNSTMQEGAYPFRGFLNSEVYPNGLQLCYELGTDVR